MKQPNGCSTPAPKSSAAKQWIKEELARTKERIAATIFLSWSLVLHRSCQLLEMRWQLYRTYAFFCRVLRSAYRYVKTMLKEKFQARLLRDRS